MNRNVLLIYPKPKYDKNPRFGFSMQLLQMAQLLKDKGYRTFFLDLSYEVYSIERLKTYIRDNEISILIVELDSFALKRSENLSNGIEIMKAVSSQENVRIVAFGYDCILDEKEIPYADYVIKKDPFCCIESVVKQLSEGMTKISEISEWKYLYDELPYPDRELLCTNEFYSLNKHSTLLKTAQGCLNTCSFCQRRGWQSEYQSHSVEYVREEFMFLRNFGYKNVWVIDENFTFNLLRAKQILRELIASGATENMKISISSWTKIDEEFLLLAKQANISIISMGIESGNHDILSFYRKNIDLVRTKELIEYADEIGIFTVGNFIIGAPMESEKTVNETLEFISNSKLNQVNIKILDYMLGSELYEKLDDKKEHHYFGCKENGLCKFSLQEMTDKKSAFLKEFYSKREKDLRMKIEKYGVPYYPVYRMK